MEKLGVDTVEEFKKVALSSVVAAVRNANTLPAPGDDFNFYSSYDGFRHFSQHQGSHLKKLIGGLLQQQDINTTWMPHGQASAEDCEDQMESLIEGNDSILERVGILLDEASGVRHAEPVQSTTAGKASPAVASWNRDNASPGVHTTPKSAKLIHSKSTTRPQLLFKDGVDNSSTPFVPRLTEKPNAVVPLPNVPKVVTDGTASSALDMLLSSARQGAALEAGCHPYEVELLQWEPSAELLTPVKEQLYGKLADTPLTYVDTVELLEEMCGKLSAETEIAVDLEAHSYRSFQGFTCLMQLSTRSEDFIVDTLKLRTDLIMLNEVFTDPKIVKVLHGSDSDVLWLQRDHSLYLVNMFDTGQASRVLEMPRFSLAYLMQFYCSVTANKQYQLADWRIRPLPKELINYAREDTHYLLYIYDRMRNELISRGNKESNLLASVWVKSRNLCMTLYEKPLFKEHSYLILHEKHKKRFDAPRMEALKLLYNWRDKTARREDESTGFVLPNEMLFQISQNLPRELQGILACCNPVPLLVRQNVQEIYTLVSQARLIPTNAPVPTLPSEFSKRKGNSSSTSSYAQRKSATPAKQHDKPLKKADSGAPIREFSHGFAISGPPIPTAIPKLMALVTLPCKVAKKSLLSAAEREVVDRVILPSQQQQQQQPAAATPTSVTPIKTPSTSSVSSTLSAGRTADTGSSPMLALDSIEKEMPEPMDEVTVKVEASQDASSHPIWGLSKPKDTAASTPVTDAQTTATGASTRPAEQSIRSLMAGHGTLKRKRSGEDSSKVATPEGAVKEEPFEPFDYEAAHKATADKAAAERKHTRSNSSSAGQAKRRAIDPTKDTSSSSFSAAPRSKVMPKSGERSKSFSSKSPGGSVQWPKR
eukprot:scpid29849/ scgid28969/ Exosome component 10; Autoantigen PM/Scl 2 homolog; Polymyositis/scleroderma autoantigen 2 homolog